MDTFRADLCVWQMNFFVSCASGELCRLFPWSLEREPEIPLEEKDLPFLNGEIMSKHLNHVRSTIQHEHSEATSEAAAGS